MPKRARDGTIISPINITATKLNNAANGLHLIDYLNKYGN